MIINNTELVHIELILLEASAYGLAEELQVAVKIAMLINPNIDSIINLYQLEFNKLINAVD
jgi:ADP-dependent phosphofructokinase/glucokinase